MMYAFFIPFAAGGLIGLMALLQSPLVSPAEGETLKWVYQIGGPLLVLVMVILGFYRRDFKNQNAERQAERLVLLEAIKASTSAIAGCQAALTQVISHYEKGKT